MNPILHIIPILTFTLFIYKVMYDMQISDFFLKL